MNERGSYKPLANVRHLLSFTFLYTQLDSSHSIYKGLNNKIIGIPYVNAKVY